MDLALSIKKKKQNKSFCFTAYTVFSVAVIQLCQYSTKSVRANMQ